MVHLNELKQQYCIAAKESAQWAMMYFMEDHSDEIRGILARLEANGRSVTFPGILLPSYDEEESS